MNTRRGARRHFNDTRKREWFKVRDTIFSCRPETLAHVREHFEEYGTLPMFRSFPDVREVKKLPTHLYGTEIASFEPNEELK